MKDWNGNSKSIFVCNGASNHTEDERQTDDYYATEPKAIELLTELVDIDKNVWECACGEGHLAKVLEEKGHNVKATDLVDRGYGQGGIDFLAYDGKFNGDIVTNPPYKYAKEFVEKALDVVEDGNKVMMFLKLTFLEGKARKKLFMATPPRKIFVSSSRLQCAKNGDFETYSKGVRTAVAYAWYVWEKGYNGETVVEWFN